MTNTEEMQPLVYIKVFFLYVFFGNHFFELFVFLVNDEDAGNGLTFSSDGWLEGTDKNRSTFQLFVFKLRSSHTATHATA